MRICLWVKYWHTGSYLGSTLFIMTVGTAPLPLQKDPVSTRLPLGAWVAAGLTALALLTVAGRYGFHGDEFYFVVTGRHLQAAAPDNPMLVPYLAAGWYALVGGHLWAFRILPALAIGAYVLVGALTARTYGLGRRGQVAAAIAVALTSAPLATGHLFETTTFDLLASAVTLWLLIRALRDEDGRWGPWVAVGVAAGIAMEIKVLIALVLLCCLIAILLLGPRRALAGPRPWVAAGIAVLIGAPNLIWQAVHGFPMLSVAANIAGGGSTSSTSRGLLIPSVLLDIGPIISIVFVVGLVVLLRRERRRRDGWLAAAFLLFVLLLLVTGGKAYYSGSFDPAVLAAGAGPVLDWVLRGRLVRRIAVVAVLVVSVIITAVLTLPLATPGTPLFAVARAVNPDLASELGWPAYVRDVDQVASSLSPAERSRTVIAAQSYALAGAVDILGPGTGVALPTVYSGHNAYWFWGPPPDSSTDAIVIGDYTPAELSSTFGRCELRQTVAPTDGVETDLAGTKIYWCTQLRHPWSQLWPTVKSFA